MHIRQLLNNVASLENKTFVVTPRFAFAFMLAFLFTYATAATALAEDAAVAATTLSTAAEAINEDASTSESAYAVDLFLPFVSTADTTSQNEAPELGDACQALNDNEVALGDMIKDTSSQQRSFMVCNPILAQVARERAMDMAARNYFGHTNPDGVGPNTLVRAAGYPLPGFYADARDGNNIESIAAGYTSAQAAFDGWMNSSGHRTHMLGEIDFYRDQVEFGIGYYYDANSSYKHYWVMLSAYEE